MDCGSVSTLSLKPEYLGDVIGFATFAGDSGSSSAGKFAESSGSDAIVGTPKALDSTVEELKESSCSPTAGVVVDTLPKPEASYSNAEEPTVADWCVKLDQGSGEPERGRAKGSSKGFSSNAREDCRKRSSKPDMMNKVTRPVSLKLTWSRASELHLFPRLSSGPANDEYTHLDSGNSRFGDAVVCRLTHWALSGTPPIHDFAVVKTIAAHLVLPFGNDDDNEGKSKKRG